MISNSKMLNELRAQAAKLGAMPAKLEHALKVAGEDFLKLAQQEFADGKNPWGRAWAKPKDADNRPMVRTGALSRSLTVLTNGDKITVKANVPYAGWLQRGSRKRKSGPVRGAKDTRALSIGRKGRAIFPYKKLAPTWVLALAVALADEMGE